MTIKIEQISPHIRYAQQLKANTAICEMFSKQIAYDNRLFLCIEGKGEILVNEKSYPIQKGSLIMWRGGLKYSYHSQDYMELIGFNFDFSSSEYSTEEVIFPVSIDSFIPSKLCEATKFSDIEAFNEVFKIEGAYSLKNEFSELLAVYNYKNKYYKARCDALLKNLILKIALLSGVSQESAAIYNKTDEIITYIQNNYNKDIDNTHLSKVFGYHSAYIGRLMVNATGMSTHKYILEKRISRAIDFIQEGKSVSEACFLCGFKDLSNFSKYFKKKMGCSPSKYFR